LIAKKRYEDAVAFFYVGGHYEDAVTVAVSYLQDL
jgi:hypothetical protein